MRLARRGFLDVVLVLAFLAALGNWAFTRYQHRQTEAEAGEIATVLEVGPQSRVADVGAGNGRFTIPLARHIAPDGYIYATELDLDRLQDLQRAVTRAELENVTILEAGPAHTGLPPHCCDGVLLRTVYHHLTEPASIAADLFAAVRPRGRLVVIDFPPHGLLSLFARVDGVPDDRGGHGIPPEVVAKELTQAGFRLERQIDDWRGRNYCLVFTRPRV